MKKKIILLLISAFFLIFYGEIKAKEAIGKQLFKNINIGWGVNRTNDYRWSNFHLGTAYGSKFEFNSKAAWQIGADLNWSKYTLYSDGDYSLSNYDDIMRTRSISFPLTVSYDIKQAFFNGVKVYTGPTYEMIFSSSLNRNSYYGINSSQLGWKVGTNIRFLAIFNTKLAYIYYFTTLFNGGNFNRSNISFSIGF